MAAGRIKIPARNLAREHTSEVFEMVPGKNHFAFACETASIEAVGVSGPHKGRVDQMTGGLVRHR